MSKITAKTIQEVVVTPRQDKVHCRLKIDNDWFSCGEFASAEVFPLKKGQVISFEYEQKEKFGLVDLKTVAVQASKPTPVKAPYKKNNDGVQAGNSRTAAFNFCKGERKSLQEMKDLVKWFAEYGEAKRLEYAKNNPKLDDFSVGVGVGQSLTAAASVATTLTEVNEVVDEFLLELIPYSLQAVRGEL